MPYWGLLAYLGGTLMLSAEPFIDGVRRDTEWLAGYASRVPGAPGHDEAQAALIERVKAIPGARVWIQEFPVIVPVLKRADLSVTAGELAGTHAIYPVWPDLVRLKTTPPEGISGRLMYVGSATLPELPARSLRGQIAVMEMSAYENWKQPFSMGASAVLLLGGRDDVARQPAQQALYMPRYYVPEGALADALRRGAVTAATIRCDAEWRTVTARNICALVKPSAPGSGVLPPVALAVPYDSMSVIMGLAPGADNAIDTAFLLNLLRETSAAEPRRAVLFCFVDAYGINQLGVRQLLTLLAVNPEDATRRDYEEMDRERLDDFRRFAAQVESLGEGEAALGKLWDKGQYRDLQRYIKDCVGPEIMQLRQESGDLRLAIFKAGSPDKARLQELLDRKTVRFRELNDILSQMLTQQPARQDLLPQKLAVWKIVRDRVRDQLADHEKQAAYFGKLDELRNAILDEMGGAKSVLAPVSYLIGLDLSDAGSSVGPGLSCQHLLTSEVAAAVDFTRWLKQLMKSPSDPFWKAAPSAGRVLNAESIAGLEDPVSFNVGGVGLMSSPAASFQIPAASWVTLDGNRTRVDTPQDLADRLDWNRLIPQVRVTRHVLKRLFDDPGFAPALRPSGGSKPKWRLARGTVVTESLAETVPRTPKVGALATLVGGDNKLPGPAGAVGIRRQEFTRTGPDGMFCFAPLPGQAYRTVTRLNVQSFCLDERGRIVEGLSDSASMIAGRVSSEVNLTEGAQSSPPRVVSFECRELNGPEFFDPRFLEPLSQFSFIDVTRGGTPKRYHFSMHDGQMFGLLLPETRWQLILRAGAAANRMMLMNLDPGFAAKDGASLRAAMQSGGYKLGVPLPSIPAHISAQDFYSANEWRLQRFHKAGITSKVIDGLHETTKSMLSEAGQALKDDDGAGLHRQAASALANEIRAYEAVRALGDDVTQGAIFLMILLVPFAVAMERLIFACRGIGLRLVTNVGIFAFMSAVLWSFHPSFRITAQPMIIVMAFCILLLSLLVIVMIMRKFEADMESIRSGHAEASGAKTTRGGVIGSAVWLGIANMRKRKLRTVLTATTIVLITFALLCFSSSTQYQNRRQFRIENVDTPAPGVQISQPGLRAMNPGAIASVGNLLKGEGQLVPRYWWVKPAVATWRLHLRHPVTGKQIPLKAGLGLAPGEREITRPDRFMPNWERFSQGDACYLSANTARNLGVKPGDRILVAGAALELAGVFDSVAVENKLKMLDGRSLLPYDFTAEREEVRSSQEMEASLAAGVGVAPDSGAVHVTGDEVVILPAEFVRKMDGELRSMALLRASREAAEKTALKLMQVLAFPMYYGEGSNVRVVVATPLIARPPRNLLIPLAIAALIIFSTMLNSVAERKKEIHIYTSLGLAPQHVGMLFLAEAATYGLMGSVFGYIVGQGLAKILTAFNLMGGITLNYSGSNVMMTMGLVMAVVLLSALVPAVMAGKLATPSKDMTWRVPKPENGVINELLPFTVTRAASGGLVAFIYEFMDAHTDGGIGAFTADHVELLPAGGDTVAGLRATTWLAPYDLGVRQDVQIEVFQDIDEVCNIRIRLTYSTGQVGTWWRLNQTFLGELRRQLLGWRNVKPERIMEYIRQAEEMSVHA